MKNIQGIIYTLLAAILLFGCEEVEREPVLRPGDAPSLTQPQAGTQLVFNRDNANSETVEFKWTEAEYGFPSATTYTLQADVAGNNFANPVELSTVNGLSATLTHAQLNNRFMMAGLPANEENDMEFRVVASVSEYVSSLISEAVPAKVTLFADSFPSIYMIGAAVGGWGTDLAVEIVSTGEPSVYTTIAYFDVANGTNFRFFNNPDWGASIGGYDVFTNYPEDLLSPATSDSDPNFNFIGEPGWYELVVNTEEGTIAMEAVSEPVMYLTGDATHGWSWDDPVTQLQWVSYNIWEGEVNFTQGGAFRLFPQKDWGPTSYGYDVITNYDTNYIDIMEGHGDPNWEFLKPSGTYQVRVDLRTNSIVITE
jgi:hypothetical protein